MIRKQFHLRPVVPIPRRLRGLDNSGFFSRICGRSFAGRGTAGLASDEGSTLVEFALATVILFSMLVGVFEFCMGFYTYHYVSFAARQGSRYAIVRGGMCSVHFPKAPSTFDCDAQESDIANYLEHLGYPGVRPDLNKMVVTVTTCQASPVPDEVTGGKTTTWVSCVEGTANNLPGDQVQVKVEYDFPLSIPFWGEKVVPVYSTSYMVYSQ